MHEFFLYAALEEARLGEGLCAPNPCVGAVAVKNGQIIARAWHRGAGTPHAERLLIEQLPADETDVTLYVTLEPCNHQGRTPPCVDAIIQYGFRQVVFASFDSNPIVVANGTSARLKAAGIEVVHCSIPEIDAFYQSYHFWTTTGKPWVTAKIAQTFDGKIAGPQGECVMLSNSACHQFTHEQRLSHDIILTTAQTIRMDNPQLNVRLPSLERSKPIAILDRCLSLKPTSRIFTTAAHCHIFYDASYATPVSTPTQTYHPVSCIHRALSLEEVMRQIAYLGYHRVWVEAGGQLFTSLHQAHLVHRSYVYLVPRVLGDGALAAYHHADVFRQPHGITWQSMGDNMIAILDWEQPC